MKDIQNVNEVWPNLVRVDAWVFSPEQLKKYPEEVLYMVRMCKEQLNMDIQNVWRVAILPSGKLEINDFTLPSSTGKMKDVLKMDEAPQWVQESLAVMLIVDQGAIVQGVGIRISETVFYLQEMPSIGGAYGNEA